MTKEPLLSSGPRLVFTDGKAPHAMRTIGEVGRALGIKSHVLRYWEQQFPMLRPLKRSGGRRYYRQEDVALIERIDRLVNDDGFTIKGARQALEAGTGLVSQLALATSADLHDEQIGGACEDILPALRAVRERLAQALDGV